MIAHSRSNSLIQHMYLRVHPKRCVQLITKTNRYLVFVVVSGMGQQLQWLNTRHVWDTKFFLLLSYLSVCYKHSQHLQRNVSGRNHQIRLCLAWMGGVCTNVGHWPSRRHHPGRSLSTDKVPALVLPKHNHQNHHTNYSVNTENMCTICT